MQIPICFWIMNLIFIIASITDKLDGYIARSRNQVTTFGKFLDPLADKILVLSALVMLVEFGKIPAWIPVIVLAREFIVSGYRLIAVEKGGKVIAASIWGKLKTVTQGELVFNVITSVVMLVSVIATIFSGYDYLKNGKDLFKEEK